MAVRIIKNERLAGCSVVIEGVRKLLTPGSTTKADIGDDQALELMDMGLTVSDLEKPKAAPKKSKD